VANTEDTLIVGYPGRLAKAFVQRWPKAKRVMHAELDITDRSAVLLTIAKHQPKLVINCAALTDMDRCEKKPDLAWSINVRGVRNLAEGCRRSRAILVHFSSDYALEPINEYAWTKRASENIADLTIRAKIYDESHWAWKNLRNGKKIKLLTNEFLNPISTSGLSFIVEELLQQKLRGLFGVGTADRLSFWQVGNIWADVLGVQHDLVEPIENLESSMPRPDNMYINTQVLRELGFNIPTLIDDAQTHLLCTSGCPEVSQQLSL